MSWRTAIDPSLPFWADDLACLEALSTDRFPTADDLNALLPKTRNLNGRRIRFVCSSLLEGADYEQQIFRTGEISTRAGSWHDLFNALVWCRLPGVKAALNALHIRHRLADTSQRGERRDALTLIDESGILLMSDRPEALEQVAQHDWLDVFSDADAFRQRYRVVITGHALLEKFLDPYKAITAKALLMQIPGDWMALTAKNLSRNTDRFLAAALMQDQTLHEPTDLTPVPVTGVPGWWPNGPQDEAFFADTKVFRSRPTAKPLPEVLVVDAGSLY